MTHPMPLEVDSGDPLDIFLASLSLVDTHQNVSAVKEPGGYNAFEAFNDAARLSGCSVGRPSAKIFRTDALGHSAVHSVESLTQDGIPEHIAKLKQTRRFELHENDALFIQGRRFQKKHGVPEEGFQNWKKSLSGWFGFPAVLLLNPSPWDHLPSDEMVKRSRTFTWLEKCLEQNQLGIDDVPILDTFPMLLDELLDKSMLLGPAIREELAQESFALTKATLEMIRPRVLISCQCCTKPINERWGFFKDTLALKLCSSVAGSRSGRRWAVNVCGHPMTVVLGMHPQYVMHYQPDLEEVLQGLFEKVFRPFGMWQSQRVVVQRCLQDTGVVLSQLLDSLRLQIQVCNQLCGQTKIYKSEGVRRVKLSEAWQSQRLMMQQFSMDTEAVMPGLVASLRLQIQLYRQLWKQATSYGMEGPVAVGRVVELDTHLAKWERGDNYEEL